jgi:hypothetical protein
MEVNGVTKATFFPKATTADLKRFDSAADALGATVFSACNYSIDSAPEMRLDGHCELLHRFSSRLFTARLTTAYRPSWPRHSCYSPTGSSPVPWSPGPLSGCSRSAPLSPPLYAAIVLWIKQAASRPRPSSRSPRPRTGP